jgi:hypothetical protein
MIILTDLINVIEIMVSWYDHRMIGDVLCIHVSNNTRDCITLVLYVNVGY